MPPDPTSPNFVQIAVEVWRLGQRLDQSPLSRERLDDSFRRLSTALADVGVRFEDPSGQAFVEGTNAEVVGTGARETEADRDELVVTQVLRPAVFVNNVCVIPPQIVVGSRGSDGNI